MATVEEDRLRLQLNTSTERLVAPVFPAVVGKGLGYIELAGHAERGGAGEEGRGEVGDGSLRVYLIPNVAPNKIPTHINKVALLQTFISPRGYVDVRFRVVR